jgi:hypothetical protein
VLLLVFHLENSLFLYFFFLPILILRGCRVRSFSAVRGGAFLARRLSMSFVVSCHYFKHSGVVLDLVEVSFCNHVAFAE